MRKSLEFGGGPRVKNWEKKDLIIAWHKLNTFSYVFLHCWAVPVPPFPPVSQQDLVVVTEASGTERKVRMTVLVVNTARGTKALNWPIGIYGFTMFLGIDQPPHWYIFSAWKLMNQWIRWFWCELTSLNINKSNCQKWMTSEDMNPEHTNII